MKMKKDFHNGFPLKANEALFPASRANEMSYTGFCFMGGLANENLCRVTHQNGTHVYSTYHRIDKG